MDRRTALAALLALPAVASGAIVDLQPGNPPDPFNYPPDQPPVNPDDFDLPTNPRELAYFVCEWDLRAIDANGFCDGFGNRCNEMGHRGYVAPIQWAEWTCFCGMGPPDWLTDRAARVLANLSDIDDATDELVNLVPILAAYRTPCGRAFAIVVEGTLTPECREEFKRALWRV